MLSGTCDHKCLVPVVGSQRRIFRGRDVRERLHDATVRGDVDFPLDVPLAETLGTIKRRFFCGIQFKQYTPNEIFSSARRFGITLPGTVTAALVPFQHVTEQATNAYRRRQNTLSESGGMHVGAIRECADACAHWLGRFAS